MIIKFKESYVHKAIHMLCVALLSLVAVFFVSMAVIAYAADPKVEPAWDAASAANRAAINRATNLNRINNTYCKHFRVFEASTGLDLKLATKNEVSVVIANMPFANLDAGIQNRVEFSRTAYINIDKACEGIQDAVNEIRPR